MFEYIKENLERLDERITAAAARSGRRREDITLIGVAKTFSDEITRAAIEYGLTDIGEARVQEAEPKIAGLGEICRWHLVGHLQSNKVTKAVDIFDLIQSVDSVRVAEKINVKAENRAVMMPVMIEVNASGEEQKHGFIPEATLDMVAQIQELPALELQGLMTIGPRTRNEDEIRRTFSLTRSLFEEGQRMIGGNFKILSMGMSGDFELAIEEGSTMIRVGTAIFGNRQKR